MKRKELLAKCCIRFALLWAAIVLSMASDVKAETSSAEETQPADPYANETKAERDARMEWWREAKFGMFIHWGPYAVLGGEYKGRKINWYSEWIMDTAKIPVAEYKTYAKEFSPVNYDPGFWAKLAKEAGMKYAIITAKHHDGFALYDSAVTDWDIAGTPYGRTPDSAYGKDLLRPLLNAVKGEGLKMGFYYSQAQDWCHPGGSTWRSGDDYWDDAQKGDMDTYIDEIAVPQVRELLSGYDLDILWWDTPRRMNKERAAKLSRLLYLRPGIITNNRLGAGFQGDTETPEQHIPASGYEDKRDWETCMTMNQSWGYKQYDHRWKSADILVGNLVKIVSAGGNYLLNVGPKPDGTIPEESIALLREVGEWLSVHGESIYGTRASPCSAPPWGRITRKDGQKETTLYLHLQNWPEGEELRLHLDNEVLFCKLLGTDRKVNAKRGEDGILFTCEGKAAHPLGSVIKMKIKGQPVPLTPYVPQMEDAELTFPLDMATFHANGRHKPKADSSDYIRWKEPESYGEWIMQVKKAGTYYVQGKMSSSGKDPAKGSAFDLLLKSQSGETLDKARLVLPPRGSQHALTAYKDVVLRIEKPGVYTLRMQPDKERWGGSVVIRQLGLHPVQATTN